MLTSTKNQNQSEIAKAKSMLISLEAKLEQVRATINEKKAEMADIDRKHHTLEQTGDINKMMKLKQRSLALRKELTTLAASEAECHERVESVKRYIETLNRKLEGLRKEEQGVAEKLANDTTLVGEEKAKLQTFYSRLKMQIEALEGKA
ncbi:MAG TPA: hypothetical protein VEZ90_10965 [Blastocatellia bacterium]|nr:hypothetical protein [Blastocatellia bacterium]